MIILGISDHVNCSAALIKDGKVLAAVGEERLVRKKMVFGVPRQSIAKVLELANVKPPEVDRVAVASVNGHLLNDYIEFKGWFALERGVMKQIFFNVGSEVSKLRRYVPFLEKLYYSLREPAFKHRRQELPKILQNEFDIHAPVEFLDHHFAHAASCYFSSGFDDALLVTMDGGGDGVSSQVWTASNGTLTKIHEVTSFNSLGNYYAYVTHICGFQAGKHEGKVTGLAAHGEPIYKDLLDSLITFEDGTIKNVGHLFFHSALRGISKRLGDNWKREDLAASIQQHAEELAVKYVSYWCEKTGMSNVALAGGLFANVRINQEVHEIDGVHSVHVHPGMTDEGLSVGACLALNHDLASDRSTLTRVCFDHVYLGPSFTDEEIEEALSNNSIEHKKADDVEEEIADLLAQGYVVARYNGRMEYGPRALGNRSILYKPNDPSVNDWLNECLRRTEFMPFAPATLTEEADKCFERLEGGEDTARFMTITYDCTPWMQQECSGVVHIDATARPQLVSEQDNPSFHKIIKAFHRRTGLPCIVNTSFNIHEEPIVCSPDDAIRAFTQGHLDVLAIGPFVALNKEAIAKRKVRTEQQLSVES